MRFQQSATSRCTETNPDPTIVVEWPVVDVQFEDSMLVAMLNHPMGDPPDERAFDDIERLVSSIFAQPIALP